MVCLTNFLFFCRSLLKGGRKAVEAQSALLRDQILADSGTLMDFGTKVRLPYICRIHCLTSLLKESRPPYRVATPI